MINAAKNSTGLSGVNYSLWHIFANYIEKNVHAINFNHMYFNAHTLSMYFSELFWPSAHAFCRFLQVNCFGRHFSEAIMAGRDEIKNGKHV